MGKLLLFLFISASKLKFYVTDYGSLIIYQGKKKKK